MPHCDSLFCCTIPHSYLSDVLHFQLTYTAFLVGRLFNDGYSYLAAMLVTIWRWNGNCSWHIPHLFPWGSFQDSLLTYIFNVQLMWLVPGLAFLILYGLMSAPNIMCLRYLAKLLDPKSLARKNEPYLKWRREII